MEDINLGAVQETALIPLAIRANETKGKRRIIDRKAAEIIEALGVDTKPLDKYGSHEGVVSRTILLDSAVKELIAQCPDAVCLNLGCGLDDRFSRVDNGRVRWRNIDLSDMIAFRRRFYAESDRERMEVRDILSDHGNQLLVKIDGIFDNFYAKYAKTKSCEKYKVSNIFCSYASCNF